MADSYFQDNIFLGQNEMYFAKYVAKLLSDNKDAKILDVCAGTGLIGNQVISYITIHS